MTPYHYLLRTHLHRAAVALRLTDQPVSAIALDADFNDPFYFTRRFLRTMGATPRRYRTARRGRGGRLT